MTRLLLFALGLLPVVKATAQDAASPPVACELSMQFIQRDPTTGRATRISDVFLWRTESKSAEGSLPPAWKNHKPQDRRITVKNFETSPRCVLLQPGDTLIVQNHDDRAYNLHHDAPGELGSSVLQPPSAATKFPFRRAHSKPFLLVDRIHPQFKPTAVLVRSDPFMALSQFDGVAHITGLPPGESQFQIWRIPHGFVESAVVNGVSTQFQAKRFRLELVAGRNLFVVELPEARSKP